MDEGVKAAERLGLRNLCFEQAGIRNVNIRSHGSVDIVLFLGILYHLDQNDVFPVLKNIYEMCHQFVVIDTHIALHGMGLIWNTMAEVMGVNSGVNMPMMTRKSYAEIVCSHH